MESIDMGSIIIVLYSLFNFYAEGGCLKEAITYEIAELLHG